jgi:hypothetical protein
LQACGKASAGWPAQDYADWPDTLATLHLWTQVVGKVRLALAPWLNHGWQVPLYVDVRGLTTSPIPAGTGLLRIDFDFVDHRLVLRTSDGDERLLALEPMSVAAFHERVMAALRALGIDVTINTLPNEVPAPIPFEQDETHAAYDAAAAQTFWRVLTHAHRVMGLFRTAWLGKASPVHFFWGSFDLAVTRFSGRRAPPHPGGVPGLPDAVTREAYSHEVTSAGFWPGNADSPHAAFYAYAYPTPAGFAEARVEPAQALWLPGLGEWVLPYAQLRASADPDATLLRFLQTTHTAAARLGGWDSGLECEIGTPARPRRV